MQFRKIAALSLFAATAVAFAQGKDDPAEIKKFEGAWVLVSGKKDGQPLSPDIVSKSKVVWTGKDVVIDSPHQSKEPIKAKSTWGVSGNTKTMDWVRSVGPDAGKPILAIYEFRGPDEYVVVFGAGGKDRPKELDAKAGTGTTMHVWKRQK